MTQNFRAKNVHDGMYTWPYADINADDPIEDHKNRKIYFYRQYMTDLTERNTKIGAVYPGFKGTVRLLKLGPVRTDGRDGRTRIEHTMIRVILTERHFLKFLIWTVRHLKI